MKINFEDYRTIIDEIQVLDAETDNIFKILHQESYENKHSTFLSWLLNPNASHGLSYEFAAELFNKVVKYDKDGNELSDNSSYDSIDATKIKRIRTEVRINGEQQKKAGNDKRRIDILVEGDGFTCTIENKYGSTAHGGQCKDYRDYITDKYKTNGDNNIFVFLDIEMPSDFISKHKDVYSNYDFISYSEILDILKELLEKHGSKINKRQKDYLKQYTDILEEKYAAKNIDVNTFEDYYKKHKKYIDLYRSVPISEVLEICKIKKDKKSGYDNLEYDVRRFIDVTEEYYRYLKAVTDKIIKKNLEKVCLDKYFFKIDYGKKKGEAGYAYAIPASINKKIEEPYRSSWEKELGSDSEKVINKKIRDLTFENIPFNTVDYRAPQSDCENISILVLSGYIPSRSKTVGSMIKDEKKPLKLDALDALPGWKTNYYFYLKTGAGQGAPVSGSELNLNKDIFHKASAALFNDNYIGITLNAGITFSDDFWDYLNTLNGYLEDRDKNVIHKLFVKRFIFDDDNKTIAENLKASLAFIEKIKGISKCNDLYSEWALSDKRHSYSMDYSRVSDLFDASKKEIIEQGIKDNYEVVRFKAWLGQFLKKKDPEAKKDLITLLKKEMKENNDGKLVSMIKSTLKEKKGKDKIDSVLGKKISTLDIDKITDENIKALTEKALDEKYAEYIIDLADQRSNKEHIPGISIRSLYELKPSNDTEDENKYLKKTFYEQTEKILNAYSLEHWFHKVFRDKKDLDLDI